MAEPMPLADEADSGLPPDWPGTVATVGTFDGVHRGHRDILARTVDRARAMGLRSLLITFEPHPLAIVNPAAAPPLLTAREEKLEIVAESEIDVMAILPFTPTLRRYTAAQFVDDVLRRRFRVRHLVIGYDHGLGRGREGDVDVLRTIGRERALGVEVVEPVTADDGRPISSTLIRRAVADGDLVWAEGALGRRYSVSGTVRQGDQRGRLLGYPTINLAPPAVPPPSRKLLPPEGVYAVRVETPAGAFGGMMNLGPRPTFGDAAISLEVHLFDATCDLYGASVKIEFVSRLRETRAFPSAEALVAQLGRDAEYARRALTRPA